VKHLILTAALPLAALLGACAGTPTTPTPAATPPQAQGPRDCAQLEAEIAAVRAEQRAAETKKGEAWKAVVPFAVAGRYASANSAIRETEQRLANLRAEARRSGCTHHA
jgi:hypothetical protein